MGSQIVPWSKMDPGERNLFVLSTLCPKTTQSWSVDDIVQAMESRGFSWAISTNRTLLDNNVVYVSSFTKHKLTAVEKHGTYTSSVMMEAVILSAITAMGYKVQA